MFWYIIHPHSFFANNLNAKNSIVLVFCKILQPSFEKLPYNLGVKRKKEVRKMFFQQDLYQQEIERDYDKQQASYIFALGYAMIETDINR